MPGRVPGICGMGPGSVKIARMAGTRPAMTMGGDVQVLNINNPNKITNVTPHTLQVRTNMAC